MDVAATMAARRAPARSTRPVEGAGASTTITVGARKVLWPVRRPLVAFYATVCGIRSARRPRSRWALEPRAIANTPAPVMSTTSASSCDESFRVAQPVPPGPCTTRVAGGHGD